MENLRDDLELEEYAKSLGYTVKNKHPHKHDANIFEKDRKYIWEIRDGWRCADIINDRFCNHRTHDTLKEALEKEK